VRRFWGRCTWSERARAAVVPQGVPGVPAVVYRFDGLLVVGKGVGKGPDPTECSVSTMATVVHGSTAVSTDYGMPMKAHLTAWLCRI
jgi:hypothetical protein